MPKTVSLHAAGLETSAKEKQTGGGPNTPGQAQIRVRGGQMTLAALNLLRNKVGLGNGRLAGMFIDKNYFFT